MLEELSERARLSTAEQSVSILDEIKQARQRLESNVRDLLVLEALCTSLIFRSQVAA
jgi:DNA polymerase-3 subunit delta'